MQTLKRFFAFLFASPFGWLIVSVIIVLFVGGGYEFQWYFAGVCATFFCVSVHESGSAGRPHSRKG